jgi:hypothetical protein
MGDFGQETCLLVMVKPSSTMQNAFAQEWQVLDTEPSLFQTLRFSIRRFVPSVPLTISVVVSRKRRLPTKLLLKAMSIKGRGKDDCVFDVLTTGDLEMAVVGAY